jgi:hypothetical protein
MACDFDLMWAFDKRAGLRFPSALAGVPVRLCFAS